MEIRYRHTRVVGEVEVIEEFDVSCDDEIDIVETLHELRCLVEHEPIVEMVPMEVMNE